EWRPPRGLWPPCPSGNRAATSDGAAAYRDRTVCTWYPPQLPFGCRRWPPQHSPTCLRDGPARPIFTGIVDMARLRLRAMLRRRHGGTLTPHANLSPPVTPPLPP